MKKRYRLSIFFIFCLVFFTGCPGMKRDGSTINDCGETQFSEDAQKIEKMVRSFWPVSFGGNTMEIYAIKKLDDIEEEKVYEVSVVYAQYEGRITDSFVCLSMKFYKTEDKWRIEYYGDMGDNGKRQ